MSMHGHVHVGVRVGVRVCGRECVGVWLQLGSSLGCGSVFCFSTLHSDLNARMTHGPWPFGAPSEHFPGVPDGSSFCVLNSSLVVQARWVPPTPLSVHISQLHAGETPLYHSSVSAHHSLAMPVHHSLACVRPLLSC
jgi:hypothetical protein